MMHNAIHQFSINHEAAPSVEKHTTSYGIAKSRASIETLNIV